MLFLNVISIPWLSVIIAMLLPTFSTLKQPVGDDSSICNPNRKTNSKVRRKILTEQVDHRLCGTQKEYQMIVPVTLHCNLL